MGITRWRTAGCMASTLKKSLEASPRGIKATLGWANFPGFSVAQKLDELCKRGSRTAALVFQSWELPAANVLGGLGLGLTVLMSSLDFERAHNRHAPTIASRELPAACKS